MTSIEREREKIGDGGRGMIASGRPFKVLTASPAGRPQQRSLKGSLSVYVCGGHFKENTTLQRNRAGAEESRRNDDKILLLDLTGSRAV